MPTYRRSIFNQVQSDRRLNARLEPGDYEALANFRYLLRKFLRFSKDFLSAKSHLSPEQYEALLAIKVFASSGALNISQLSERLQVRHHSAVNIVDRLVERKLITREAVGSDRRRRFLELTPRGDKLIEELASAHRQEIRGRSGELIEALERLKK
jgi:DNA-binding MarR family transcriptional regulator